MYKDKVYQRRKKNCTEIAVWMGWIISNDLIPIIQEKIQYPGKKRYIKINRSGSKGNWKNKLVTAW